MIQKSWGYQEKKDEELKKSYNKRDIRFDMNRQCSDNTLIENNTVADDQYYDNDGYDVSIYIENGDCNNDCDNLYYQNDDNEYNDEVHKINFTTTSR